MLKSVESIESGFDEIEKKTQEQCKNELAVLVQFINDTSCVWYNHIESMKQKVVEEKKVGNSLIVWIFNESPRTCGQTLFLTLHGLYRNAFDNIRHMLEAEVQALYLDYSYRGIDNVIISRPEPNIFVKIAILREVEDKRDYHALRLMDELHLDHKDRIKQLYKELSQTVHPSHKRIEQTMADYYNHTDLLVNVDCEEVGRIRTFLINIYDVLLYFYLVYIPEAKDFFFADKAIIEFVKKYELFLVSKLMKQYIANRKKSDL